MRTALTRPVPASLARCQLTHLDREPIDIARAVEQHRHYEAALRAMGCTIRQLPAADDLPDSVFVEDVAIVLDEIAVITRPGAESRRGERESVAPVLSEYRELVTVGAPGTIDGGDLLRLGETLFVGLSSRTNEDGVKQLARFVERFGYSVQAVQTRACLHLKSAATALAADRVLCNPAWVDEKYFEGIDVVYIAADEPRAANVLCLGNSIVCSAGNERTIADLRGRGYSVIPIDVSELAKAEAGITCCSLIVE